MRGALLVAFAAGLTGCAGLRMTGKVAVTPLTVVRDFVDAPLVTITNGFETFANRTRPARAPRAGIGWSWRGGPNLSIGYDVSHFLFRGFSWAFGAVDYVIGRSVWPNFAGGVSPWRKPDQSWGSLYFPSTRALWPQPDTPPSPAMPSG